MSQALLPVGEVDSQDDRILEAIANGATQMGAAHLAGCSVRTVQRRLADPEVKEQLEEIRRIAREEILGRLSLAAAEAVEALWKIAQDSEDPELQIKAAAVLLNSLVKVHGLVPKRAVETTATVQRRVTIES